jgi:hypothetical protein
VRPKRDIRHNHFLPYLFQYQYSLIIVPFEFIQGIPGEKVSILGRHSIGHSKQTKLYVYMCPIPNGFRDRAISLYSSKIVDKKDILRTVSDTGAYCYKWQSWYILPSIIHFRKFHRQHQCTLQLVWVHGLLLVCTVYIVLYSEIALSRKPFGMGHMYIYTFCLEWPILWPPRISTFPPGALWLLGSFRRKYFKNAS